MSWITDLAGKAENVLNKLDGQAASVLTNQKVKAEKIKNSNSGQPVTNISRYNLSTSSSVPENLGSTGDVTHAQNCSSSLTSSFHETSSLNASPKYGKSKKRDKEHSLINFLNSDKPSDEIDKEHGVSTQISNAHSRQSSVSSGSSFLAVSGRVTPAFASLDIESSTGSGGSGSSDAYITLESPLVTSIHSQSSLNSESKSGPQKINENYQSSSNSETLLKKEIYSLNQEMSQMLKRSKESEKESQKMKEKLSTINLQQKQTEALLRDMQENESKLQEILREKDKMMSLIDTKCKEAEQRVEERNQRSKELQEQNRRLLEGANMSNNLHSDVVVSLQDKLKEAEQKLSKQTEQLEQARSETSNRIIQLEEDQRAMTKDISDFQKKLQEEKSKYNLVNDQKRNLKEELTTSRNDLDDYKTKAGRILQSKDKLIQSLKEGSGSQVGGFQEELFKEEIDQIKNEKELLREEVQKCYDRIEQLSASLVENEAIFQQDSQHAMQNLTQLEEDLQKERSETVSVQEELKQCRQEMKCVQEELTRNKVNISFRINERDEEIRRLQKQIAHKQSSSSSLTELENRIHGLTESLILKQNTIESLSTDKHTLQIQLEKLQDQYQESQNMLNKDSVIDFSQEEVRSRGVPTFLMESPFDGGVTRRVKKAYGTLDKFSIRLGIFLRRYPIARVFVLLYIGLLHGWVMIVLLTYKPEIHGNEFGLPTGLGTAPKGPH